MFRSGPFLCAYATNTLRANVPVMRSVDGVHGRELGDALPALPPWSEPGWVWAPAVLERDDGFVLYYTTRDTTSGRQCVSAAVGSRPEGPFVDAAAGRVSGPGGAEVFHNEVGDPWIVFHGWLDDDVGYAHGVRSLFAVRLAFDDGIPTPDL